MGGFTCFGGWSRGDESVFEGPFWGLAIWGWV